MLGAVLLAAWGGAPPRAAGNQESRGAPERHHTLTGTIRTHADFSSRFLEHERTIWVYLPPGYAAADSLPPSGYAAANLSPPPGYAKADSLPTSGYAAADSLRYPVLYMHDGQNVFDAATSFLGIEWGVDETAERLIRAGEITPLIVVGVANSPDRIAEYTPVADPVRGGGEAGDYGRFLVEELKPFIDATYRTLPGAEHTGVAGSSLGGLVSLHLGLAYPEVFQRIGAVSPSVAWAAEEIVERYRRQGHTGARIWLDIGT